MFGIIYQKEKCWYFLANEEDGCIKIFPSVKKADEEAYELEKSGQGLLWDNITVISLEPCHI